MKPKGTGNVVENMQPEELIAALLGLYSRQEVDERIGEHTAYQNGMGFNNADAKILSSISKQALSRKFVSDKQFFIIKKSLPKYAKQIQSIDIKKFKIEGLQIGSVEKKEQQPKRKELQATEHGSDSVKLSFDYDPTLIAKIKAISGRRYFSKGDDKFWTIPLNTLNLKKAINIGFSLSPALLALLDVEQNVPVSFEGLRGTLWPYQVTGATRLAGELNLKGILADEMGLGKTAQALAAIHARRDVALPALVVCPSVAKYVWEREAKTWCPTTKTSVISGFRNPDNDLFFHPADNEITIINYDLLYGQLDKKAMNQYAKDNKISDPKKIPEIFRYLGWGPLFEKSGYKTIVLDESHKIKNAQSKRTTAVKSLAKRKTHVIAISGTPIENRPKEFFTTLEIVCPHLFGTWWTYAHKYCNPTHNGFGWDFNGASNTEELHTILTESVMIRRLKKDVLKDLPEKVRSVIPVEINMAEYNKAEKALRSFLQTQKGTKAKSDKAAALAEIERCKQAAVVGKLDAAIEWIGDYLETDKKLVVFAHHTFVLDKLQKHYGDLCVRVDGSVSVPKRQEAVDAFQNREDVRLFLGNIKAAGVAITLTAASDTLTLELGWMPGEHDQAEDRVHRFGQEAESVNAYYLVARETIEEKIADMLDKKRNILSQVLDGKDAEDFELLTELLKQYGE